MLGPVPQAGDCRLPRATGRGRRQRGSWAATEEASGRLAGLAYYGWRSGHGAGGSGIRRASAGGPVRSRNQSAQAMPPRACGFLRLDAVSRRNDPRGMVCQVIFLLLSPLAALLGRLMPDDGDREIIALRQQVLILQCHGCRAATAATGSARLQLTTPPQSPELNGDVTHPNGSPGHGQTRNAVPTRAVRSEAIETMASS